MFVEWTKDLNTGIDVIDEQHKRIVNYINQLDKAIIRNDDRIVGVILTELFDYCYSHLAFEEHLMLKAGYPHLKPHKATHDMFAKRLEKFQAKYNAGENIAIQLHEMLSAWFIHHIKQMDMAYATESKEILMEIVGNKEPTGWFSRNIGKFFKLDYH
jgi:hemerythrin